MSNQSGASGHARDPERSAGNTRSILALDEILNEPIGWQYKAFPAAGQPVLIREAGTQGWNALKAPFTTPVMLIKDRALQHNIDAMAEYCTEHDVSLSPHTKTPLSPQIAERQLAAGAWALTVADVHQIRVLRRAGAQRLFVANEIVDDAALAWVAQEVTADPTFELFCLVDSAETATRLDSHLAQANYDRKLPVLVELGIPGARCGCRTPDEAKALAREVGRLKHLKLAGVEGYENLFPPGTAAETIARVDDYLQRLCTLVEVLDADGSFSDATEVLVSAGGSMWFDRVAAAGGSLQLTRPVRTVVRAGAYVTHDAALYQEFSPLGTRNGGPPVLSQGLELWASVLSRPEPDLVILNFGKRDAAHDRGFPIPFATLQAGHARPLASSDHDVFALSDQHARLRVPVDSDLAVGDLVGSHVSHPCTSFDNWRLVPLVDDDYNVISAVRSYL